MLRGRVCFAGSHSSLQRVSHILVTPSVARGVTPLLPLRGRSSALGEGLDTPLSICASCSCLWFIQNKKNINGKSSITVVRRSVRRAFLYTL